MLWRCAWVLVALTLGACASSPLVPLEQQIPDGVDALVVVLDDPRPQRRRRGPSMPGYTGYSGYADDPALERAANRLAEKYGVTVLAQWPFQNIPIHCVVIEKPDASIVSAMEMDPSVNWVQPFVDFTTMTVSGEQGAPVWTTGTKSFANLGSGRGITIAVIDTSVDRTHPALRGSALRQRNFAGRQGDALGESHGTAMVGLMAAQPQPDSRVVGISRSARIESLRACWQQPGLNRGRCNTLTMALALDAAASLQPEVLNLSITGPSDRVLDALIAKITSEGTLVVAAYDERREDSARFPSPMPGVVYAFGTSTKAAQPRESSAMIVSAPRHALSLVPSEGYDLVHGHSVAAAQVSGLAALLFAQSSSRSRARVVEDLHTLTQTP